MPYPKKGEKRKDYISRCIPAVIDEGRPQKQSVAMCYSFWKNRKKKHESMITSFQDFVNERYTGPEDSYYSDLDDLEYDDYVDDVKPYFQDGYTEEETANILELPLEAVEYCFNRLSYDDHVIIQDNA